MALYRPRMIVRLYVPNVGTPQARAQQEDSDDVTLLEVRCNRARWESNNHNEADEAEVTIPYDDAGVDPRFLKSAELQLYVGDGDEHGNFQPSLDNLRFVGIATDVARDLSNDDKNIVIRALDYTTLFLSMKHYPPPGIPDFSMTVLEAWHRICDNTGYFDLQLGASTAEQRKTTVTSTVQRLRDRLTFVGLDSPGPTLGAAVSPRLAKLGKLQVRQGADAWAVWQTAVGSLGLISFIRGDRCIVTTATDFYTADDPPRFVYGKTIQKLHENRDTNALSGKNVGLFSFDPLTLRTVEAYWPPLDLAKRQKKTAAGANGGGLVVHAQDYEVFDYQGGTIDEAQLQAVAKCVWEQRSRQELTGELTTSEMFIDTLAAQRFDVLKLAAGDRVRVEIDRSALEFLSRYIDIGDRETSLVGQGYSKEMAHFIATNLDAINKMPPEFQVHSVSTELDTSDPEGGRYESQIRYLNRIDPSGASQVSDGKSPNVPPVTGQKSDVANSDAELQRNGVEHRSHI